MIYVHLLDDVGAELLDRQSTNIAGELTDNSVTESVVIEIKDVLHNLKTQVSQQRHKYKLA